MLPHLACLLLLTPGVAEDKPAGYPRADLLAEPADLVKPGALAKCRILDARTKEKYEQGHVSQALWVDHDKWAKDFAANLDESGWERAIGGLGIAANTPVVIYDDARFNRAARIWWTLKTVGVRDARLLNGGWKGWQDAGGTAVKDFPKIKAATMRVKMQPERLATKTFVLTAVKEKSQIVDARSKDEYTGADNRAKRGGAIPGAKHLEWSDAIDPKTQRFKSASELAKLFKGVGVDPTKPCTTYCQSGGRAAVMAFTLELMGAKDVRNYYKSWAEWGNAEDTPIAQPNP